MTTFDKLREEGVMVDNPSMIKIVFAMILDPLCLAYEVQYEWERKNVYYDAVMVDRDAPGADVMSTLISEYTDLPVILTTRDEIQTQKRQVSWYWRNQNHSLAKRGVDHLFRARFRTRPPWI